MGQSNFRPRLPKSEANKWQTVIQAIKEIGINKALNLFKIKTEDVKTSAKVLVYDIETAPLESYTWGIWKQNISATEQLKHDWFIITWAGKWLFEDNVKAAKLTPEEAIEKNDERITLQLWEMFNEADIVIAHNALKFDNRRMNTRFLKMGLPPPMPYQTIDTLIHARKHLAITSNRLDYIGEFLGLGRKIKTEMQLWLDCIHGNEEALAQMEKYNIQDVLLLESVYLALRPYIKPHPNMGLFIEDNVVCCPSCGSSNIEWSGQYATYVNLYDAFRCLDCGSIGRSRKTSITTEQRQFLTVSVPK